MNPSNAAVPRGNVHDLVELRKRLSLAGNDANKAHFDPAATAPDPLLRLTALPVAIYTTDADGRITFFNEAAATLWGRRPLLGTDRYCGSWRIVDGGHSPLPHDRIGLAVSLKTGKDVAEAERVTLRPDGSRMRVAPFATLLRDDDGTVTGAFVMLIDAPLSQVAMTELPESVRQSQGADALDPQMTWMADPQGRILEFGDRWCGFIGQSRAQALRTNWQDVVNPGDIGPMRAAMAKALTSGENFDARFRVRTASGEERWVRSRAEAGRDAQGIITCWHGSTEDIHDAVLIEDEGRVAGNRHALIAQAADDVLWDMDLANDVVTWGAMLKRRFAIWPEGGKSSRGWWLERIHTDDRARVLATIAASLASTASHHTAEYRFRRGDGSYAHVLDRAKLIRDQGGRVVRAVGAMLDRSEQKSTEEALRLSQERLRAAEIAASLASDAGEHIAWDFDVVQDVVTWSAPLQRRFGLWPDPSKSNRDWWGRQMHPEDRGRMDELLKTTMAGTTTRMRAEYRFRRADGSYAHVLDRGSLIRNDAGQVVRAIGAMIDLTERRNSEGALRLSEERFRLAATAAGIGIADIDLITGEKHWSPELRAILGLPDDAVAGPETYLPLIHPEERAAASARHHRDLRGDIARKSRKSVYRIIRPNDGAIRWLETERHAISNDEGAVVRIIITNKDITEQKTAQDRINWAATHDALTGLPNRSAFQARFDRALGHAGREAEPLGLLLIDLDNFKHVNDSLGHQAGDRALIAFAERIREAMPADGIVFRFGGDEFAVILPRADASAAAVAANDLTSLLQRPASIGDRNLDLRASIGVAAYPNEGNDAIDLVQNADLALYAAKAAGGATMRSFDPALRAKLKHQLSMLSQARDALDNGWIQAYYQPKVSLATGRIVGLEALLRWRDPKTGLKLPATIASAFDDTELAGLIGETMVLTVLGDMKGWIARGVPVGKVAINASAAEFRGAGFAERLLARMAAFDVPPAMLELEITETALLGDSPANVVAELETLRAAGMTIALDDFGTGFSSLSHLRNFPVDAIKIDRSFVAGLSDSAEDRAIVEAILRLGEALGMTTVAEGVETQAQADHLRAHGCTLAQGFLYAPALDAGRVPEALIEMHTRPETGAGERIRTGA